MGTNVVIVGGGPAGSACAIYLAKLGIRATIVEREQFPRFHIGESLTAESGNLLRDMGLEQEMIVRGHPIKYGVRIFGPAGRSHIWVPIKSRDTNSQLCDSFAWQVRRSGFDAFLLDTALERGTTFVRGRAACPVWTEDCAIRGVTVELEGGESKELMCDVLVDASGQKTFLAGLGVTGTKRRGHYDNQVAIYSHFTGAVRDPGEQWGNTVMFFRQKHQWAWMIPLDEAVTSIGLVVPSEYYRSKGESLTEFLWRELRTFNPELACRTEQVRSVEEVRCSSNYSYRVERFTGKGWLCIGDAHRFLDPLFSFGVNIAMAEGRRAAMAIANNLTGRVDDAELPFLEFERWSTQGVDVCETVLDSFWDKTFVFGLLVRRYTDDFIDLLAGRVWDNPQYTALSLLRESVISSGSDRVLSADGTPVRG